METTHGTTITVTDIIRATPGLKLEHPNGKGTGCALRIDRHAATAERAGFFGLILAPQATLGDAQHDPTFDWDGAVVLKLDFGAACEILQVLRGETETVSDGKGLYFDADDHGKRTVLRFKHIIEPFQGYLLELHEEDMVLHRDKQLHFCLSPFEGLGLGLALENEMGAICFGSATEGSR